MYRLQSDVKYNEHVVIQFKRVEKESPTDVGLDENEVSDQLIKSSDCMKK